MSDSEKLEEGVHKVMSVSSHTSEKPIDDIVIDTVKATQEYTESDYKRILRKTDLYLMPLMWIAYGIQQADKTGLSTQATFGIRADTHLTGQEYPWLTSIFYIGFIVGEIPANFSMQRFSIRKSVAISMLIWGGIVMGTAGARNWSDLMALRFLQGLFESIVGPAFVIMTGMWYTREEQAHRSIVWGTANSGFTIITSLCMYGIGQAAKKHPGGLAPWKGMSYFLGGLTLLISVIMYFFVGSPREVFWLTDEERRLQAARVVGNNTGTDRLARPEWKWSQVKTACKDPQTYLFFFVIIINAIPTGGTNAFANLIYSSFGFDALESLSKGVIPQSAFIVVWFIFVGTILRRWQNGRFYMMLISTAIAFAGMLGCGILQQSEGRLWSKWGCYLITGTGSIVGCIIWTFLPSNIAGRTKKSVTAIVVFIAYCTGNSIGAQVFQARWAPNYRPSIIILAVFYALEFTCFVGWMTYYKWVNKKRIAAMGNISEEERLRLAQINAEKDMTDYENPYFLYTI